MTRLLDEVADQLNLRWAWEKVLREAIPGDNWFDQVEVAAFDLDLERNLESVASELREGRYHLTPLRPLPFPKHSDEAGKPRVRQIFQISVRDQVAWTAVVNLLGPYVDSKMPAWSYGNRLYRSMWIEDDNGIRNRKIGRYRHATGQLYLPFSQSWPVFRRHVFLATRAMTGIGSDSDEGIDKSTQEELEFQEHLHGEHRCPFVRDDYWQHRRPLTQPPPLYWCSIDLEKFYPTINLDLVRKNIMENIPLPWRNEAGELLNSMLHFQLDLREWSSEDLAKMDLTEGQEVFAHVPTGLYVAGFLANASLLEIDASVSERLRERNIAHFRFVDDHIILGYKFETMVQWIREYSQLLRDSGTGAHINPTKIEPKNLAMLFSTSLEKESDEESKTEWKSAEAQCRLDPQFPSPLMTKTLTLISGIARTDFNLLELQELTALTEQLEHLLLIDIPNEEIPEKTRLSFAATRLIRIVECRLANPEPQPTLIRHRDDIHDAFSQLDVSDERRLELQQKHAETANAISAEQDRLKREVRRAFQLLRKVLRERPDRARLWTRALLMCRQTGVRGLLDLISDIHKQYEEKSLASEYLHANLLVLLGEQAFVAARICTDEAEALWRREAAQAFLEDLSSVDVTKLNTGQPRWFLRLSWLQYCFGLYCADRVLKDSKSQGGSRPDLSLPETIIAIGRECLDEANDDAGHEPAHWAWWISRKTLRDLEPHANQFVQALASDLRPSIETSAFWRFFPLDVPTVILKTMLRKKNVPPMKALSAGWWFDSLRKRPDEAMVSLEAGNKKLVSKVRKLLSSDAREMSLYEWCEHTERLSFHGSPDPRCGEWTVLEIVRQIANLVAEEPHLGLKYLVSVRKVANRVPYVHPANFRIPKRWLERPEITWDEWKSIVSEADSQVVYVRNSLRIEDRRYTPLSSESPLFSSVNPVRGLGLVLYGLLKNTFDLPTLWNGPGHSDVLQFLPRLLLQDVTCSSWTLGVLAGCLQPRAIENLFLKARPPINDYFDEDTLRDPVTFLDAKGVSGALTICQDVLVKYQLSTLNQKARQLTPVSILQLTRPEWTKDFADIATGEDGQHE